MEGMAARGITGDDRRGDRAQARGVRRLRLPREPLGELRLPRVLELVDQAPLPGRVRVRAAQRAADGLLLAAHASCATPRRHGVEVLGPVRRRVATRLHARAAHRGRRARSAGPVRAGTPTRRSTRCGSGCDTCAGLHDALLDRIDDERAEQPFADLEDFIRRTGAPVDALEALATAGAFGVLRRTTGGQALWAAGALRDARRRQRCPGVVTGAEAPHAAGHDRGRGDRRRPVGDGPVAGPAPHRVRARGAGGARASSPRPTCASCPTARSSRSRAW